MNKNNKVVQQIQFVRNDARGRASCQIEVFEDGSAYVAGDDVEVIFEESAQSIERAVKYVEARGYVRCPQP